MRRWPGSWQRTGMSSGVRLKRGQKVVPADAVIVTTGGLSYPSTGSTGDGYRFREGAGTYHHRAVPGPGAVCGKGSMSVRSCRACPCAISAYRSGTGKKVLYEEFGEMLFTHFRSQRTGTSFCQQLCCLHVLKKGTAYPFH